MAPKRVLLVDDDQSIIEVQKMYEKWAKVQLCGIDKQ